MKAIRGCTGLINCALGFLLLGSCGDEGSRQEEIKKLRAIGAVTEPLFVQATSDVEASNAVQLRVFVAVPNGKNPALSFYADEAYSGGYLLTEGELEVTQANDTFSEYNELRLYEMTASITVPSLSVLSQNGVREFYPVRYGVKVTTEDDTEEVVGTFMVYPEGSPDPNWTNPEIAIAAPQGESAVGAEQDVTLKADYANPNQEELKFGWFVTGGKVINRRSTATTWKTPVAGQHTVIATVHGKTSRGFGLKVLTVDVE